ncbi:MAG: hypothetical protein JEZ00_11750 [Anaerolineaceae bacterium]|nr:hypothetical protein [Anaerolineaceae bacterium]
MEMQTYPERTSIILVAIIPNKKDLEIARVLGWYRIPIRSAPKIIQVDYLCFYQPASFGAASKWKVETFARMRGSELVQRKDLFKNEQDHPRAKDEYYKIQLGQLMQLPMAIDAGNWRRFTFLYTTGEKIQRAGELKDLVVRDEERNILWRTLRERAKSQNQYHVEIPDDFNLDPAFLRLFTGSSTVQ